MVQAKSGFWGKEGFDVIKGKANAV